MWCLHTHYKSLCTARGEARHGAFLQPSAPPIPRLHASLWGQPPPVGVPGAVPQAPGMASGARTGGSIAFPRRATQTTCPLNTKHARHFVSPDGSSSANALPDGSEDLPSRLLPEGRSSLWVIQGNLKGAAVYRALEARAPRGCRTSWMRAQAGGTSYPWAPGAGRCPFTTRAALCRTLGQWYRPKS